MQQIIIDIKNYLKERIQAVDNCYEKEVNIYYDESIKSLNVTCLNKKEKEELLNKRNCLLIQKHCYNEILEFIEKKVEE